VSTGDGPMGSQGRSIHGRGGFLDGCMGGGGLHGSSGIRSWEGASGPEPPLRFLTRLVRRGGGGGKASSMLKKSLRSFFGGFVFLWFFAGGPYSERKYGRRAGSKERGRRQDPEDTAPAGGPSTDK